jgi:hypothetical protein
MLHSFLHSAARAGVPAAADLPAAFESTKCQLRKAVQTLTLQETLAIIQTL